MATASDPHIRFYDKVKKTENCWHWIGGVNKAGTGRFNYERKVQLVHRVAFKLAHGSDAIGEKEVVRTCKNTDCVNPAHLMLRQPHRREEPLEFSEDFTGKFWRKCHMPNPYDCWRWHGYSDLNGFGTVFIPHVGMAKAHRAAYLISKGPIEEGQQVLHTCRNRDCVNPAHLFLGWPADSIAQAQQRGIISRETSCAHGHEFTPENTYTYKSGQRGCKRCNAIQNLKRYHDKKAEKEA